MLFDGNGFAELPVNMSGRDFIVSDLHGQLVRLRIALDLISFAPDRDRLIAVGDIVDKGPGSAVLLGMLRKLQWFVSVVGNHELLMRAGSRGGPEAFKRWARNDMGWVEHVPPNELDQLVKVVDGMPIAIELPLLDGRRVGIVHAEIPPRSTWDFVRTPHISDIACGDTDGITLASSILWGRRRAMAGYRLRDNPLAEELPAATRVATWEALQPIAGIDLVVAGHTQVPEPAEPMVVSNCVFIETAAFQRDGWLTVMDPLRGCYWQVGSEQNLTRGPLQLPAPCDIEPFRPTPEQIAEAATRGQLGAEKPNRLQASHFP